MDFIDELRALANRVQGQLEHLQTEEATKNAIIMPFINIMGYDVFNPTEIVPEFTADIGMRKGEKVDYAIIQDGLPIILIECKSAGSELNQDNATQLFRYFTATSVRFGILTNGIDYQFFSDLDEPNKMDTKPFMEFNLLDFDDQIVEELKRFTKTAFDLEDTLSAATELKYTTEIKRVLAEEMRRPSEDFVRLLAGQVYSGRMTQSIRDQFTERTRRAFQQLINDRISDRLKSALAHESEPEDLRDVQVQEDVDVTSEGDESGIVTTKEEIDAYNIIRAILWETVDVTRIVMRDTKSYCGILLDDNNRKPICRLRFNSSQRYLVLIDDDRQESRHAIVSVEDIFSFANELKARVALYES